MREMASSSDWAEVDLDGKLLARQKETFDSPIPSESGTAARLLLRLAARTGERRYGAAADRALTAWRPLLGWARAARGTVALYRALAHRLEQRTAAGPASTPGDVSLASDLVQVDAFLERSSARPGERVRFAIRVVLEPGWHVNGARPADTSRVATTLSAAEGAPVTLAEYSLPTGEPLEGTFWIRGVLLVPERAAPGPRRIPLILTLQACGASSCQAPRDLALDLPLRFDSEADGERRHPGVFGD